MAASKKFPLDLFKHGVKVFFGNEEELVSMAKKDGILEEVGKGLEESGSFSMVTFLLSSGDALIYGKKKPESILDYSIVSHEILHATSHILRNVGIEHTSETEEVYAYVIEDLTWKIFTWLSSLSP